MGEELLDEVISQVATGTNRSDFATSRDLREVSIPADLKAEDSPAVTHIDRANGVATLRGSEGDAMAVGRSTCRRLRKADLH